MHYTPKFLTLWEAVTAVVAEDGEVSERARIMFRDGCLAMGHEERVRNLYRVRDKLTREAVFLVPNAPQEEFMLERSGRDICLKTRQVGMTTLSCVRALDMALWQDNAGTGIMAHLQNLVSTIFEDIVKFTYTWFKKDWGQFYAPVEKGNSSTALMFSEDGLGRPLNSSMRVLYDFRGKTINFLHVAEAAFTENDRLLGSLQAVPATGEVILESTPNGRGGEFYRQWQNHKALGKQAPYKGFFVPWWKFYPENPDDARWELDTVSRPLTDYERSLLDQGLNESHVAWRRWCVEANCLGDPDKFENEYPSNDIDCFFTGEAAVFSSTLLKALAKTCKPAAQVGYLLSDGPRVKLHADRKGVVSVWKAPEVGVEYVVGADPSAGVGKDKAVGYVINRVTNEMVARIEGFFEPTDFGDELYKLGVYFNKAWICPEENNHGHTVIQRLKALHYPNIYKRKVMDEITNKPTKKVGFLTTNDSKLRITENFKKACQDGQVVVYDNGLIDEMSTFTQYAGKGFRSIKREATPGAHDDRVMAACLAFEMSVSRGPLVTENESASASQPDTEIDPETGFAVG